MPTKSIADVSLDGVLTSKPDFRILYKYQRISEHALDALRSRYLYFSAFTQLNDPFDPFLTLAAGEAGELAELFAQKGPKIFCLAEDQNNPLMWAHYADSGAGMCIGYAVYTGSARLFNPVRYFDEFVGRFNILELLSLKSRHWEHESEWRGCVIGPDQKLSDIAHPVSIRLGPRCSTENMERVRAAMPATVTTFEIIFPMFANGQPQYGSYDVDAVVNHYGGIPTLEKLFAVR